MNYLKLTLLIIGLAMSFASCEGPEGPQGPQGPPGAQGPQGPAGESGPEMNTYYVFAAVGEFVSELGGRVRRTSISSSEFPLVDPQEEFVAGFVFTDAYVDAPTPRYNPLPFTYYGSRSISEGWIYDFGLAEDGRLWLHIKRTNFSVMAWDDDNNSTGWNYRFFVFSNDARMNVAGMNYEQMVEYAAKNPDQVVRTIDMTGNDL